MRKALQHSSRSGYALFVVSVLLLLFSYALLASLPLSTNKKIYTLNRTEQKLDRIKQALNIYYTLHGKLPCPSIPDTAFDDSNLGSESVSSGSCVEAGTLQRVSGKEVYIGALPARVLDLPSAYMFDGWGNRFTYAVDRDLKLDNSTTNKHIRITDLDGNPLKGRYGEEIPEFLAVVLSHGENGVKAYNKNGDNTPSWFPDETALDEYENADYDAAFIKDKSGTNYDDLLTYITPCPAAILGCELWIDASESSTVTQSGGLVSGIYDKSGNGIKFSESTYKPTYLSSEINGLSVLDFDGSNDRLTANAEFLEGHDLSTFIVAESDMTGFRVLLINYGEATKSVVRYIATVSSSARDLAYNAFASVSLSLPSSKPFLLSSIFEEDTMSAGLNGATSTSTDSDMTRIYDDKVYAPAIGWNNGSSASFFGGHIGEVITYERPLKSAERARIDCMLAKKWAVFPQNGLDLWLDADDASTITESSGKVSSWADKSGNGNDATQATASKKPTTGSDTLNGKNVLTFDGGDTLGFSSFAQSSPQTIFMVYQNPVTTANESLLNRVYSNNGPALYDRLSGNNGISIIWDGTGGTLNTSSGANTNPKLAYWAWNGANEYVGQNGAITSFSYGKSNVDWWNYLGSYNNSSYYFSGTMAEVLIYDRYLSEGERKIVECYLAGKWSADGHIDLSHDDYPKN